MLPPQAYEEARRSAPHVVVITVERVEPIDAMACAIHGRVLRVERGRKYKKGAEITIEAPALGHAPAHPPAGGAIFQDSDALRASRYGRAYLSETGELTLSQYQIMADRNARPPR